MTAPESRAPRIPVEPENVAPSPVRRIAVASVVITVVAIAVAGWLEGATMRAFGRPAGAAVTRTAPREIGMVDQTLIEYDDEGRRTRALADRRLSEFGWVDRDAGIARVPIEQAMDLYVAAAAAQSLQGAPANGAASEPAAQSGAQGAPAGAAAAQAPGPGQQSTPASESGTAQPAPEAASQRGR